MPLPKPKKDEKKDEFISRCLSSISKEEEEKPRQERKPMPQRQAMCFEQWRKK